MGRMKRKPPTTYVAGVPIKPSDQLLKWLQQYVEDENGKRKKLKLPVVTRFEDEYRLDLSDAFVGQSASDETDDAVYLELDDGGMSEALLTQLRDMCPKTSDTCVVWLEGYWGPLVEDDFLDDDDDDEDDDPDSSRVEHPFAVLAVAGFVDAQTGDVTTFVEKA
ncbi:MAG: hypothetical protein AAF125_21085 [Chloroflexota bacterium]